MPEHVRRVRRKRRVKRVRTGRSRFTPALLAICAASLLLGFGFGWILLTSGPQAYRSWRESSLLKTAAGRMAKEDFDGATGAAREALKLHHDSLASLVIQAEASEQHKPPVTVSCQA